MFVISGTPCITLLKFENEKLYIHLYMVFFLNGIQLFYLPHLHLVSTPVSTLITNTYIFRIIWIFWIIISNQLTLLFLVQRFQVLLKEQLSSYWDSMCLKGTVPGKPYKLFWIPNICFVKINISNHHLSARDFFSDSKNI